MITRPAIKENKEKKKKGNRGFAHSLYLIMDKMLVERM